MERVAIKGCKTVEQFKIMQWVEDNFVHGSVSVEFTDRDKATITDGNGDKLNLGCTQIGEVCELGYIYRC
jgi:hypothetical protein